MASVSFREAEVQAQLRSHVTATLQTAEGLGWEEVVEEEELLGGLGTYLIMMPLPGERVTPCACGVLTVVAGRLVLTRCGQLECPAG